MTAGKRESDSGIAGLAGVLIWTSAGRFPAMAAFYRDVLGLPVRTDRINHLGLEWPDRPESRLTIVTHAALTGPATDPLRLMVNLAVDDIHAVHRRLSRQGVAFTRSPEQESWGGWIATFADPDGNVLQLLQSHAEPRD